MRILEETGLTYDDVQLVPVHNTISSRFVEEVSTRTNIFPTIGKYISVPIISANMDTVTEDRMARAIHKMGGLGIIHRFMTPEEQRKQLHDLGSILKVGCIGVGARARDRMHEIGEKCDAVLVDIAHGDSDAMVEQIRWLKESEWKTLPVIAGNIATEDGAHRLIRAGADCLKVGVGPGSLCTTRIQTGVGIPQLTAVIDVSKVARKADRPITVIADGGIRQSGDIAKAIAAGADAVMVGSLFAGTEQTPGKVFSESGDQWNTYKIYRGMASREAQESWKGYARAIEGERKKVRYKGSVEPIFKALEEGLRSSMTYLNARDLDTFRKHAAFMRQTAAGVRESHPHGLF